MAKNLITQAPGATYHWIKDRLAKPEIHDPADVSPGQGAIIEHGGKKVAVFREEDGTLHTLSPVCKHLACIVGWNGGERTWDCPCHGSRYNFDGTVIHGPAKKDLDRVSLD